jgi:outer membrane murein-binding lipoprotein Lpp
MRLLLAASVTGLLFAGGCSSKPEKACQHMIDLATSELDKEIEKLEKLDPDGKSRQFMQQMRDRAKASTGSDLETCVTKMKEHDIDASCILGADSLDEAQRCMRRKK